MSECATQEELDEKYARNYRITISGDERTIHRPCWFCGEPDLMIYDENSQDAAFTKGAVCKHCRRGIRCVKNAGFIGWTYEFFQTCGPDIPSWMRPIRPIGSLIQ